MTRVTSGLYRNGQIAALLRDFAAIQQSKESMFQRAASAILALEEPNESLLKPPAPTSTSTGIGR